MDQDQPQIQEQTQQDSPFKSFAWLLAGVTLGAIAAYFLDPARGKRRRNLLRDQFVSKSKSLGDAAVGFSANIRNHLQGWAAQNRAWRNPTWQNDDTLNQHARSEFGRKIRHAKSIESFVKDGVITVAGPIFADEVPILLRSIRKIRGIRDIINHLEVHTEADSISGLQGAGPQYLQ